jgi:hypothetical protein
VNVAAGISTLILLSHARGSSSSFFFSLFSFSFCQLLSAWRVVLMADPRRLHHYGGGGGGGGLP